MLRRLSGRAMADAWSSPAPLSGGSGKLRAARYDWLGNVHGLPNKHPSSGTIAGVHGKDVVTCPLKSYASNSRRSMPCARVSDRLRFCESNNSPVKRARYNSASPLCLHFAGYLWLPDRCRSPDASAAASIRLETMTAPTSSRVGGWGTEVGAGCSGHETASSLQKAHLKV